VSATHLITKLWEGFHVALTAFDLLIENNSVEAFLAAHEFVGEGEVSAGSEAKKMEEFLDLDFSVLDSLGNFDLLLTSKQGDLTHLLEIHPNGIVEDVEFLVFGVLFRIEITFLLVLEAVNLGGVDDLELHLTEPLKDGLDILLLNKVVRQDLVNIVVSEIFLFLSKFNEFPDFLPNFRSVDTVFWLLASFGLEGWSLLGRLFFSWSFLSGLFGWSLLSGLFGWSFLSGLFGWSLFSLPS